MERKTVVLTTTVFIMDKAHRHILLKYRDKPEWHGWAAPGGHVDFPESFADCARREVMEETGFSVEKLRFFAVSHSTHEDNGLEYIVFNYVCECPLAEHRPMAGEEPCQWFALEELEKLSLADGMQERIEMISAGQTAEEYGLWCADGSQKHEIIPMI